MEGNNHYIIQRIMNLRVGTSETASWEETTAYDSLYNFKWKPFSNGIKYDQISTYGVKQLVNHIEGHECLTTKDQLFINMRSYCEKVSPHINVFDLLPLTFILDFKSENVFEQYETFKNIHKLLETNLALDCQEINKKLFNFHIATERKAQNTIKNHYKLLQSAHDHKNIWLLKPTGLNRGRGIHIFTSVEELKQILVENYDVNFFGFSSAQMLKGAISGTQQPRISLNQEPQCPPTVGPAGQAEEGADAQVNA